MRNAIFKNIFLAAMSVFLVGMACTVGAIYSYFASQQTAALETEARSLAAAINSCGPDFLDSLGGGVEGVRVTWIGADGTVLFDTEGLDGLSSHADREEVREALETGSGSASRYSDTLGQRTTNYALRLEDGTVLRVSASLYTLGTLVLNLFTPILAAVVLAMLLSFLLAARLSRQITQPLGAIDLQNPDDREVYEELRPLVRRISGQNRQIQQKVEELKVEHARQDTMRREFTANVSHELKTPLTSISGCAELIQNGLVKPEDVPRFAGTIYTEAQRLIVLVNDIIRLSRLEDQDVRQEWERIDLLALCRDTCDWLAPAAASRHVTLEVRGEALYIRGVRKVADEILGNLCDNAVKYNKPGGTVTVTVFRRQDKVAVEVRDTGIGIPQEDLDRVFERFYRVDKSHSKELGGTGLGLSIVKHGAAFLGAELEIESREGEGTAIRVLFPPEQA